jgi:hypothetical protein
MTQLYGTPHLALRLNGSIVVLVIVILYGFWELWRAFVAAGTPDSTGALFGILFIGGGLYGLKQTWDDNRDRVAAFSADAAAGRGLVALWRPFSALRIEAPLDQFTNWQFHVKVGSRNLRTYFFLFRAPGYPRNLQMEFQRGEKPHQVFRQMAPSAVEEFEANTGADPAA